MFENKLFELTRNIAAKLHAAKVLYDASSKSKEDAEILNNAISDTSDAYQNKITSLLGSTIYYNQNGLYPLDSPYLSRDILKLDIEQLCKDADCIKIFKKNNEVVIRLYSKATDRFQIPPQINKYNVSPKRTMTVRHLENKIFPRFTAQICYIDILPKRCFESYDEALQYMGSEE